TLSPRVYADLPRRVDGPPVRARLGKRSAPDVVVRSAGRAAPPAAQVSAVPLDSLVPGEPGTVLAAIRPHAPYDCALLCVSGGAELRATDRRPDIIHGHVSCGLGRGCAPDVGAAMATHSETTTA